MDWFRIYMSKPCALTGVSRLRKVLNEADTGVSLVTVRGSGYVLNEDR